MAFQLSPASINEPEGTVIDLQVTVEPGDWQEPNSYWLSQCANTGISDADWVAIMRFDFMDGTAEFGNGPSDGDLHLTLSGSPRDDSYIWFQCETGSMSPTNNKFWTTFDIVINNDELDEPTETATLNIMSRSVSGSEMLADSTSITIEGNTTEPYYDWSVTISEVQPTALLADESISIKAVGQLETTEIAAGGWAMVFLISSNSVISLNDTILEARSFEDFSYSFSETFTGMLDVEPGTYWVGACSTINDDDSSNDCSAGVEIRVLSGMTYPDLAVVFLDADPRSVYVGGEIDVTTDIRNQGEGSSGESIARVYLTLDDIVTDNDPVIANAPIPPLGPGNTFRGTGPIAINVTPGEYYLAVCAEAVPDETDLVNNCGLGPRITVLEEEGDGCNSEPISCGSAIPSSLGGEDCTAGPRGPERYARKFTFDGMIGDRLFLNANWASSLDGYLLLEGPNERIVTENDNYTGTQNSKIEYELKQNGTYVIWATSFPSAAMGAFDLSLTCDSEPGPDLTLDTPTIGEGSLVPGQVMELDTRLRNMGDEPSDSTRLRYMLSSNNVIDLSDTQLGSNVSGRLEAGSSRAVERDLFAPSTPGAYYLGVCVDAVAGEGSISNNCSPGRQIFVSPRPECTEQSLSCGQLISGSLSTQDCISSPRGNGFLAEALDIDLGLGREVNIHADWMGLDGYLVLTAPDGTVAAENDNSTGADDSLISLRATQSGIYRLWATSFNQTETGSFEIELECGPVSAPDLVASKAVLGQSGASVGSIIDISGTVRNEGSATSEAAEVAVMLSTDKEITKTDEVIHILDLPTLGSNESTSVEAMVQVPGTPGNYWLGLCAAEVSGETLTENNCSSLSLSVPVAGIQSAGRILKPEAEEDEDDGGALLIVSSGNSCGSNSLSCGASIGGTLGAADCDAGPRGAGFVSDPITFTANQGDTVSISTQWTGIDGYLYLEDPIGDVVAENDDSTSTSGSRMEIVADRSGTYTVWPTAFTEGTSGSYQVSLECNNPQAPDLEVDKPELSATTVRSGQSLTISTRTRNKGGLTAGVGVVDFILAASPELTGGDRILTSTDVPALPGGASSTESTEVAIQATPGTYYIGTCANLDGDELDTDNNCAVAGPVTIEATGEPIEINNGLNDAWYNPVTSGQGFFINIFPDNSQVFLSWFTFDTTRPPGSVPFQLGDPGQRWLTAQGAYDQGVAELNVFLTQGGVFDSGTPAASTNPTPYGTMTLSFSDCNSGLIEYNLPSSNESGSIAITRVSSENVAACEEKLGAVGSGVATAGKGELYGIEANGTVSRIETEGNTSNSFNYNSSLNDAWYNPATNGQGFFFNIFPKSNFVFLSWFTYELTRPNANTPFDLGEPGHRWLTAQGPFNGDTASMKVYSTSGGLFNQGSLPPENTVEIGTLTASFTDCNAGLVSYAIDSVGRENNVPIQRTASDSIPGCESKSAGGGGPGSGAGSGGNTDASTPGVYPSGKQTLENLCDGSVNWQFDWPDVEGASYYLFQLYRNDSLVNAPRVSDVASLSEFDYSGKESSVERTHLDNWRWRYRPVMGFGVKTRVTWSKDFYFNVKPPENPCLD